MVSNNALVEKEASTRRREGFLQLWELEIKWTEKEYDGAPSDYLARM